MPRAMGMVKGLLVGAAVGAAAALLLAPKAGKETRNAIKSGVATVKDRWRRVRDAGTGGS